MNPESLAANLLTNKARDRQRILAYIQEQQEITCDEVEVALGMRHQTASARISDLLKAKVLERTGEKRETRSGAKAGVLRLRIIRSMADAEQVEMELA